MSTGGSQVCADSVPATRKNCRCRRSACSRSESASPHIQLEKSRDLTGVTWRQCCGNQARRKFHARFQALAAFETGISKRKTGSEPGFSALLLVDRLSLRVED